MYEFDEDTEVEPIGEGGYRARLSDRWGIGDRQNGGYVLAIALRAMAATTGRPDPLTVTGLFFRPPTPGDVEVQVESLREGRKVATVQARVVRENRALLHAVATFADLAAVSGPEGPATPPDEIPPPGECLAPWERPPEGNLSIAERFHLRIPESDIGWLRGQPSGRGVVRGYLTFADGRPSDGIGLVQMTDALVPSPFDLGILDRSPTIELTAHVRRRPAPGWIQFRVAALDVRDGFFEEDVTLWDSQGALVARSRQLAMLVGSGDRAR